MEPIQSRSLFSWLVWSWQWWAALTVRMYSIIVTTTHIMKLHLLCFSFNGLIFDGFFLDMSAQFSVEAKWAVTDQWSTWWWFALNAAFPLHYSKFLAELCCEFILRNSLRLFDLLIWTMGETKALLSGFAHQCTLLSRGYIISGTYTKPDKHLAGQGLQSEQTQTVSITRTFRRWNWNVSYIVMFGFSIQPC